MHNGVRVKEMEKQEETIMVNCNTCEHINMTEKQQYTLMDNHICNKYARIVIHKSQETIGYHGYIHPCHLCNEDNNKYYKERDNKNG